MYIKIDEDMALEMLVNRVKFWTDDIVTIRLYESMYENYIDSGCFDNAEFNVMMIVDNDYINWCEVISEGDDAYEVIKILFNTQGIGDISCDNDFGYSYIEAEYDGSFLVRW